MISKYINLFKREIEKETPDNSKILEYLKKGTFEIFDREITYSEFKWVDDEGTHYAQTYDGGKIEGLGFKTSWKTWDKQKPYCRRFSKKIYTEIKKKYGILILNTHLEKWVDLKLKEAIK